MDEVPSGESKRQSVGIRASLRGGDITGSVKLEVISADDIQVEDSSERKYLRLRNGDYQCFKSVFLVIAGERHEITMDSLPDYR